MPRIAPSLLVFIVATVLCSTASAQAKAETATATCNFDQEKQLVVEYQPITINPKKPLAGQVPFGKVWAPGGRAMTLFTNTPVTIGSKMLPIGAYTMFVIPSARQWTLIVSKSTDMSGAYDEQKDLARVPMDSGELPNPERDLFVSFGHVASQQCNIRIDLDKYGHFTGFKEQ